MSPEQALGETVDGRSDVYALGVMLFEMLTGRVPFEGRSFRELIAMHVAAPPPDVSALRKETPAALAELVNSMLSKAPAERPDSAELVRTERTADIRVHSRRGWDRRRDPADRLRDRAQIGWRTAPAPDWGRGLHSQLQQARGRARHDRDADRDRARRTARHHLHFARRDRIQPAAYIAGNGDGRADRGELHDRSLGPWPRSHSIRAPSPSPAPYLARNFHHHLQVADEFGASGPSRRIVCGGRSSRRAVPT